MLFIFTGIDYEGSLSVCVVFTSVNNQLQVFMIRCNFVFKPIPKSDQILFRNKRAFNGRHEPIISSSNDPFECDDISIDNTVYEPV